MNNELKTIKDVPEILELRLCYLYCDGSSSLVSLKHRVVLVDECLHTDDTFPTVDLVSSLRKNKDDSTLPHDYHDCHEARAAQEAGLDPNGGFPGWQVIFDYLDKHPEALEWAPPLASALAV